jgi:ArsR family transcriptional regulator
MAHSIVLDRLTSLADFTRSRLLYALEGHELTVGELCTVLQLPQSTVSRHLKVLGDDGWLTSRAEGTSRYYRRSTALDESAQGLWNIIRQEVGRDGITREDGLRVESVLRARRNASREFFSSAAMRWDTLRRELYGERVENFALLALLDPTWTVGDLGCGTGALSVTLAPHVHGIIAIDASEPMLAAAAVRLRDAANVELRSGDLEGLPIASDLLDAAFLSLVLHYVAEPVRALVEALRVLRPGGRLAVVDMQPHAREEYREQMGHVWQGFSSDQFSGWMCDAGFDRIHVHPVAVDERAKGPALFLASGRKPVGALHPTT